MTTRCPSFQKSTDADKLEAHSDSQREPELQMELSSQLAMCTITHQSALLSLQYYPKLDLALVSRQSFGSLVRGRATVRRWVVILLDFFLSRICHELASSADLFDDFSSKDRDSNARVCPKYVDCIICSNSVGTAGRSRCSTCGLHNQCIACQGSVAQISRNSVAQQGSVTLTVIRSSHDKHTL